MHSPDLDGPADSSDRRETMESGAQAEKVWARGIKVALDAGVVAPRQRREREKRSEGR